MKGISNVHPQYVKDGKEFPGLGTLVHEEDESGGYDVDEAKLFKNQRRYTILSATGCSCWDGDYEGWTDLTKAELKRIATAWSLPNSYNKAEKTLGKWILDNWKEV